MDTTFIGKFEFCAVSYTLFRDKQPKCGSGCSEIEWSARGIYSTELFATEVVSKIKAHASLPSHQKLFVYAAFQSVHSPIEAPAWAVEPYKSVFTDSARQTHAGMLSMLDLAIGNITDSLEITGLINDAVIVVTTDNGGPRGSTCGDCNGASNYPLRGGKHSLYEGGVRGTGFVWSRKLLGDTRSYRSWNGMAHIVGKDDTSNYLIQGLFYRLVTHNRNLDECHRSIPGRERTSWFWPWTFTLRSGKFQSGIRVSS